MNIYDVHIKNGEIIDGTGAPKFKSDIVIDNSRPGRGWSKTGGRPLKS